jgi:hypothetical protein
MKSVESIGISPCQQVLCVGDSMTQGILAQTPYPTQLSALLPTAYRFVWNHGVSGMLLTWLIANPYLTELSRTGAITTAVCWKSVWPLDYTALATPSLNFEAAWADFVTWTTIYRSRGCKVIVPNAVDCSNFTADEKTVQGLFNARLASGRRSEVCDATVDLFASLPNAADTSLFVDGIHPTTLGYGIVANLIAPAVLSLA